MYARKGQFRQSLLHAPWPPVYPSGLAAGKPYTYSPKSINIALPRIKLNGHSTWNLCTLVGMQNGNIGSLFNFYLRWSERHAIPTCLSRRSLYPFTSSLNSLLSMGSSVQGFVSHKSVFYYEGTQRFHFMLPCHMVTRAKSIHLGYIDKSQLACNHSVRARVVSKNCLRT